MILELWIETAWCSFLSSSALLSSSAPLSSAALLLCSAPLSSPLLLCSPPLLPSPSVPFLLFSPPPPPLSIPLLSSIFPPPAPGLGYPMPICHPNFIKDWLDIWHKSVGLTSYPTLVWVWWSLFLYLIWGGNFLLPVIILTIARQALNAEKPLAAMNHKSQHDKPLRRTITSPFLSHVCCLYMKQSRFCTHGISNVKAQGTVKVRCQSLVWLFVDIRGSVLFTILPIDIENLYRWSKSTLLIMSIS